MAASAVLHEMTAATSALGRTAPRARSAVPLLARLGDLFLRVSLGLYLFMLAGANGRKALAAFWGERGAGFAALELADGLSALALSVFVLLILWLFLVRLPPITQCRGFRPWAAAFLGTFLQAGVAFFPRVAGQPIWLKYLSSGLTLAGTVLAICILAKLGRSFSITPQARRLVTTGVYRVVRHPLYAAELVATVGVAIPFLSPGVVALIACQFACQMMRIHYEEEVLRAVFPDYADYARRTARLIPHVY